jgi:hypothetical protein
MRTLAVKIWDRLISEGHLEWPGERPADPTQAPTVTRIGSPRSLQGDVMSTRGDEPGVDDAEMRADFRREADARLGRLEREAEEAARQYAYHWLSAHPLTEWHRTRMWAAFRAAFNEERGQKG